MLGMLERTFAFHDGDETVAYLPMICYSYSFNYSLTGGGTITSGWIVDEYGEPYETYAQAPVPRVLDASNKLISQVGQAANWKL